MPVLVAKKALNEPSPPLPPRGPVRPGHVIVELRRSQLSEWLEPAFPIPSQQRLLALRKRRPARVISGQASQLALDADELGAVGVAVLVEPVGVHQPRRILVGVL